MGGKSFFEVKDLNLVAAESSFYKQLIFSLNQLVCLKCQKIVPKKVQQEEASPKLTNLQSRAEKTLILTFDEKLNKHNNLSSCHFSTMDTSRLFLSVSFPTGPGTFSGPRLTTPYPRGQRFPAPPFRFPASASHTTGRTCARLRTTMAVLLTITLCWCTVSDCD